MEERQMFQVFDNNKPADCHHHGVHKSWDNSKFNTFDEAQEYARKWLGQVAGDLVPEEVNEKIDYSGYGDTIEIREIPEETHGTWKARLPR